MASSAKNKIIRSELNQKTHCWPEDYIFKCKPTVSKTTNNSMMFLERVLILLAQQKWVANSTYHTF